MKVGLLGDWLIESVRGDRVINGILQEISTATGETVSIAVRAGMDMQFVTIIPSSFPVALNITEGTMADLFESAVGVAWFASQEETEIERLVKAENQQRGSRKINVSGLMSRVRDAKNRGANVAYEKILPSYRGIAAAYSRPLQGQMAVIWRQPARADSPLRGSNRRFNAKAYPWLCPPGIRLTESIAGPPLGSGPIADPGGGLW